MSRRAYGFTLIEVLIALIIATAALIAVSQGAGSGLILAQRAARLDQAVSRARSHLADCEHGNLLAGEQGGDDGSGYRWRTTIEAVTSAIPRLMPSAPGAEPRASHRLTLFTITTTVSWREGSHDKSVSIATQAIGPGPIQAP